MIPDCFILMLLAQTWLMMLLKLVVVCAWGPQFSLRGASTLRLPSMCVVEEARRSTGLQTGLARVENQFVGKGHWRPGHITGCLLLLALAGVPMALNRNKLCIICQLDYVCAITNRSAIKPVAKAIWSACDI